MSFVMICQTAKRSAEAHTSLDRLCQMDASITQAYQLPQAFLAMVLERRGRDLEAWITAATDSAIDALATFARGMQEGLAAVKAGLTLAWSNGVTEGQIHRLKLVKRQEYGRAGFALLRQRELQAA
jgi:transposase